LAVKIYGNHGAQQEIFVSTKVSKEIVPFQQEIPISNDFKNDPIGHPESDKNDSDSLTVKNTTLTPPKNLRLHNLGCTSKMSFRPSQRIMFRFPACFLYWGTTISLVFNWKIRDKRRMFFVLVETITGENKISWLLRREMQLCMSKMSGAWSLQMRLF